MNHYVHLFRDCLVYCLFKKLKGIDNDNNRRLSSFISFVNNIHHQIGLSVNDTSRINTRIVIIRNHSLMVERGKQGYVNKIS